MLEETRKAYEKVKGSPRVALFLSPKTNTIERWWYGKSAGRQNGTGQRTVPGRQETY